MKFIKSSICLLLCTLSLSAFSLPLKKSFSRAEFVQKTKEVVLDFHIMKFQEQKSNTVQELLQTSQDNPYRECIKQCRIDYGRPPNGATNCMKVVCEKLGTYACDQSHKLEKIAKMCAGVSGDCVKLTCEKLESFACNQEYEIEAIVKACKGVIGRECVDFVCDKLGTFACNRSYGITNILKMCKGVRSKECLEFTCERLGSYACNQEFELKEVIRVCSGRS